MVVGNTAERKSIAVQQDLCWHRIPVAPSEAMFAPMFFGAEETKLKNGGSDEATRSAFCNVTQGIFDKETIISVKNPVIETLPDLRLIKSTDW